MTQKSNTFASIRNVFDGVMERIGADLEVDRMDGFQSENTLAVSGRQVASHTAGE